MAQIQWKARKFGFDNVPDPRDDEYKLVPVLKKRRQLDIELPPSRTYALTVPPFNQGNTDWCGASSWYHFFNSDPNPLPFPFTPEEHTALAKTVDEWDGEDYFATSLRADAKVLEKLGYISPYLWAEGLDDMRIWMLAGNGPVITGMEWTEGMLTPDKSGFIHGSGKVVSGHATLISGWSDILNAVLITNSFGPTWGKNGQAWMPIPDFEKIFGGPKAMAITCETKFMPKKLNERAFRIAQQETALYLWENPRPMGPDTQDW